METIDDVIHVAEVSDGELVAGELFRRKFADPPPAVPHHIVAFYRKAPQQLVAVSYVHFRPFGDIMLVGGACTDGRAFAHMQPHERAMITPERSAYLLALRFAFERFRDRHDAYFGYCNDPRAEAVDLQAGFVKTEHPHLLVHWTREMHPVFQRALVAKAAAIGPF
jgi:hypothetical protein